MDVPTRRLLLVVDDEPDVRLLVNAILADDYDIIEAADGLQALTIIEERTDLDLVLLDIRMPGLDGIAVLERLEASHLLDRVHVVAFSAHAEREVTDEVLARGVAALVRKPFSRAELAEALAAAS